MSSSKKPKATKLPKAAPAGAGAMADVEPGKAANFSDEHVGPANFDRDVRSGDNWVRVGASLLRAARAVLRQVHLDFNERLNEKQERHPGSRSDVVHQAVFLAALSVENGLKAVIAEGLPSPAAAPSGVLPAELRGHDLLDLASPSRASIIPGDDHEREALKRGQNYIEWLGRYPSTAAHDEHHTRAAVDLGAMFSAYERLFLRCVEEAARRRYLRLGYPSDKAAKEASAYRALFAWSADGVAPLPLGTTVLRIKIATYPGYVTWSASG
jgi:hypothetical protein